MKLAVLFFTTLVLAGCSSSSTPPAFVPPPAPVTGANQEIHDKRVTIDPKLNGIIRVVKIQDMSANQGFLRFQVDLLNVSEKAQTILYQVDWLDEENMSLGVMMDEPPCTLFRGETYPIAISSPAAGAKSFHITFRPRG